MTFTRAQLIRLRTGTSAVPAPQPPSNLVLPTISGTAVVGGTLTATHGTWAGGPTGYETVFQVADAPLFDQWTTVQAGTALTYAIQSGDIGKAIRFGERALNLAGWGEWSYSLPSGVVVASAPPLNPPVIVAAGDFTASAPVYVGDAIEINAATVTGATAVWYRLVRDGAVVLNTAPVATDQDSFPLSYTVTSEDVTTTFELETYASNATGTVHATSADIGPVAHRPVVGGALIDLGGPDETEAFILANMAPKWTDTGSPTISITATSPDDLMTKFNAQINPAAPTERIEVTLDWNGILQYGSSAATALDFKYKPSASATALPFDNGGWVRIKAASGKKPGFANQVKGGNLRGWVFDGVDFAAQSTSGSLIKTQAGFMAYISGPTYATEPAYIIRNCRVGLSAVSGVVQPSNTYLAGIYTNGGVCEQIQIENTLIDGVWFAVKVVSRNTWVDGLHVGNNCEDFIKLFGHTYKTGYYAYAHIKKISLGSRNVEIAWRAGHCDLIQTGHKNDKHLGYRVVYTDAVSHNAHKWSGGGSQTFQNGDYNAADNLFCVRRVIGLATSPNGLIYFSPNAKYVSYVERCTFGRAGMCPSGFAPDTGTATDNSPGINNGGTPALSGIALKVVDCLVGIRTSQPYVQYIGTPFSINYGVSMAGVKPEDVFNGRDFTRGGPTVNNIPNKFGYALPNEATQAGLISDIIANFTPLPAYAGKGAPPPNPADYSVPVAG